MLRSGGNRLDRLASPKVKKGSEFNSVPPNTPSTPWLTELEELQVNDEAWTCYCGLVIEAKPFYRVFVNEFEHICRYGYRDFVRCLSMSDVFKTIWIQSTEKDQTTPLALLCQEVVKHSGKQLRGYIPADLLAPLLKYIILDIKKQDIKRKNNSYIVKQDFLKKVASYQGGVFSDSRKKKNTPSSQKSNPKDVKNKKKEKFNSKLHKRGEEMVSPISVKDSPSDGPDLYLFCIQFEDIVLPLELSRLGIQIQAMIQIGHSDLVMPGDGNKYRQQMNLNAKMNFQLQKLLSQSVLNSEMYYKRLFLSNDIRHYWRDFFVFFNDANYQDYFKDLAIVKFIPTLNFVPTSFHFLEDLRTDIYNGLVSIMYELVALKNSYKCYREEVIVINVSDSVVAKLEDFKFYNGVLDSLPLETLSVGIILDVLVTEVCLHDDENDIGYEIEDYPFLEKTLFGKITQSGEERTPINCLNEKISQLNTYEDLFKLPEVDLEEKSLLKLNDRMENTRSIRCVIKEDSASFSSVFLPIDKRKFIKDRSIYMCKLFWEETLWKVIEQGSGFDPDYFNNYTKELASLVDVSYKKDIMNAFISLTVIEQSFFEHDRKVYWPHSVCREVDEFDSISENKLEYVKNLLFKFISCNKGMHSILNRYDVLRKMSSDVMLQKLYKDFIDFGCLKWKYIPLLGNIVCKIYDSDVPRKSEIVLPTILPFQNFLEKVFFEKVLNWDLVKNKFKQNRIYYEPQVIQLFPCDREKALIFPILIRNKYMTYVKCIPRNSSEINVLTESNRGSFMLGASMTTTSALSTSFESIPFKENCIYDVGFPSKTEFSFSDLELSFNEGAAMRVKYCGRTKDNMYLAFSVKLRDKHNIHYHTPVINPAYLTEIPHVTQRSLIVEHTSGMMFSFKIIVDEEVFKPQRSKKFKQSDTAFIQTVPKFSHSFRMNLSWPSGLFISYVKSKIFPSYLKQEYVPPHKCHYAAISNEKFRCLLPEGVVLKFMKDGTVILLYPNGKAIHCYEFKWDSSSLGSSESSKFSIDGKSALVLLKYKIRYSDGETAVNDQGAWSNWHQACVLESDKIHQQSQMQEFSDGVVMLFEVDGSLVVQHSDGTKMTTRISTRCGYLFEDSESEVKTRGSTADENPSADAMKDDDFEEVVFVSIDTFIVEHNHYATAVFLKEENKAILKLPHNIEVEYLEDGNIYINLEPDIRLATLDGSIYVEEHFNEELRNQIMFGFENPVESNETSIIGCFDNQNNSFSVDNSGVIRIDKTNNEAKINNGLKEAYFAFDKNCEGFQFYSSEEFKKELSKVKKREDSVIYKNKNDTFVEFLTMVPFLNEELWFMNIENLKVEDGNRVDDPSTYGATWSHPFHSKPKFRHFVDGVTVELLKKINFGQSPSFEILKILTKFLSQLEDRSLVSLKGVNKGKDPSNDPPLDEVICQNENLATLYYMRYYTDYEDDCERRDTRKAIVDKLVVPPILYAIYSVRLSRVADKYLDLKRRVAEGQVPPYFESSQGAAYNITADHLMANFANSRIEKCLKERANALLDKDLQKVSIDDLLELKCLLNKDSGSIWKQKPKETKYSLEEVLVAGCTLYPYFKNLREVIEFHIKAKA